MHTTSPRSRCVIRCGVTTKAGLGESSAIAMAIRRVILVEN